MPSMPLEKLEILKGYIRQLTLIIKEAREGALDRQDSSFGDDGQVLGIRAYKHIVQTIESVRGTEGWEWMNAYAPKGRLTIQISLGDFERDRILLRIWRADDPELEPELKRLILAPEVYGALELFPTEKGTIDRWGLVYQTTQERLLDTAYLVGFNSQSNQCIETHEINVHEMVYSGVVDLAKLPQAVPFEAPKLKLKSTVVAKRTDENGTPEP